jgi:hypothetical protein
VYSRPNHAGSSKMHQLIEGGVKPPKEKKVKKLDRGMYVCMYVCVCMREDAPADRVGGQAAQGEEGMGSSIEG